MEIDLEKNDFLNKRLTIKTNTGFNGLLKRDIIDNSLSMEINNINNINYLYYIFIYVDTIFRMMIDDETFIPCKYDWSDVEEKIDYVLSNYKELQPHLVENMRKRFTEQYSHENLALHLYDIFRNLPSMSVENAKDTTSDLTIEEVDKILLKRMKND